MSLEVGNEATIVSGNYNLPIGTRVKLISYNNVTQRWHVSRMDNTFLDTMVKELDLIACCTSSQLCIDRAFLQELYDKGTSDVKAALHEKYPNVFGTVKTERICRSIDEDPLSLANVYMSNGLPAKVLIGQLAAPNGYDHKCLFLAGDENLKFEILSDKVVTIVQI